MLSHLERSHRPGAPTAGPVLPQPDGPCAFCPDQLHRLGSPQRTLVDPGTGRVDAVAFPNVVPYVSADDGTHEVVILSSDHGAHLLHPHAAWRCEPGLVLLADRLQEARAAGLYPSAFLNHGRLASASQPHPHAQVLSVGQPSPGLVAETPALREGPGCALCSPTADLTVLTGDALVVLAPAVQSVEHELILAPREHRGHFDTEPAAVLTQVAHMLGQLGALTAAAWGPHAYNLLWHQQPGPESFHWHVHIAPRLAHVSVIHRLDWPMSVGCGADTVRALRAADRS